MKMTKQESDMFYEIFRKLLQFSNRKYKLFPKVNYETDEMLMPDQCAKVIAKVWEDTGNIDEFLSSVSLPDEQAEIVRSWKRAIYCIWSVVKHLKKGTVFMGENGAFMVQGIISSVDEMLKWYSLPMTVRAVIIPFKDRIITDGLIMALPVSLGPGIRKNLNMEYKEAKEEGRVYDQLTEEVYRRVKGKPSGAGE